ncbi:hypothetical protein UY416_25415 [Paenibacillus polymyxa]|uniref:hypothetical protein n=1 Tax=Paenibacillus polymyxa TaxID=1406 RepID=UPI002AB537EB|nr:hypothetical protein [Paenibacillus polymyxa]MDY8049632.1 hypothetical protein [Paenibacillus polymyxa]
MTTLPSFSSIPEKFSERFNPLRNPIIVTNQDGRPEVFMIGEDYKVRHRWLLKPSDDWAESSNWSDWTCMGDDAVAILAVAKNVDGRIEVFGHDPDNYTIKHKWQTTPNGGWSDGWASLGGEYANFKVETNQDGRIELFAISVWGAKLHHNYQTANGGWSGWSSLNEAITLQTLSVGKNADGRIEVFAQNFEDNALWHIWQSEVNSSKWSQWGSLGDVKLTRDKFLDTVAVGQNADGRLEVFIIDENLSVKKSYQTAPNGSWNLWGDVGLKCTSLFIGKNANGCLELFANADDSGAWHKLQKDPNSSWSEWETLGYRLDLLGVGNDKDGNLIVINGYMGSTGPAPFTIELWDVWIPELNRFFRWSIRENRNKC